MISYAIHDSAGFVTASGCVANEIDLPAPPEGSTISLGTAVPIGPTKYRLIDGEAIDTGEPWHVSNYAELRRNAYPSIGDQLDILYHAGLLPEELAAQITAVKEMYPKP